jgi:hypothetical protein
VNAPQEQEYVQLTKDELKDVVKDTVHETLTTIGIESDDPIEMQKDFSHLREWRITVQDVRKKGILTIVGLLVAGVVAFIWIGFKMSVK